MFITNKSIRLCYMALINSSPGQISKKDLCGGASRDVSEHLLTLSDEIVLQPGTIFVKINPCISFFSQTAVTKTIKKKKTLGKNSALLASPAADKSQITFRFISMTKCTATPHTSVRVKIKPGIYKRPIQRHKDGAGCLTVLCF